jgi:uncharacterized membrane protein YkgB
MISITRLSVMVSMRVLDTVVFAVNTPNTFSIAAMISPICSGVTSMILKPISSAIIDRIAVRMY